MVEVVSIREILDSLNPKSGVDSENFREEEGSHGEE